MIDLKVKYLGLELKNPIIAGSCGLTNSVKDIVELEKNGAAAVVLKSLFEEEIIAEMNYSLAEMNRPSTVYPEIFDYFAIDDMEDTVTNYLELIREAKKNVSIPIIASVNCVSAVEWTGFAKRMQNAGADAIELNMFILPSDFTRSSEEFEKVYFDVIKAVKSEVTIPVSLKISYYFSNLGQMIKKLSESGIDGLVLFNRFFSPDIDIENNRVIPSSIYSSPSDISISLRWIGIMADRVSCDLASSTGVHDGKGVVKQLLAGANAVQFASALYKHGPSVIGTMLDEIKEYMEEHSYESISDFRGKLSQAKTSNPAAYERAQFMKHFAGK